MPVSTTGTELLISHLSWAKFTQGWLWDDKCRLSYTHNVNEYSTLWEISIWFPVMNGNIYGTYKVSWVFNCAHWKLHQANATMPFSEVSDACYWGICSTQCLQTVSRIVPFKHYCCRAARKMMKASALRALSAKVKPYSEWKNVMLYCTCSAFLKPLCFCNRKVSFTLFHCWMTFIRSR